MPFHDVHVWSQRSKRFLIENRTRERLGRLYHPLLEYPLLFREFVAIPATEDGFVEFANKYGMLGVESLLAQSGPMTTGEPFNRWKTERNRMRSVVDVLDAVRAQDDATLSQWFSVQSTSARYERCDDTDNMRSVIALAATKNTGGINEWLWEFGIKAPNVITARERFARGWAQSMINKALDGSDEYYGSPTTARITFDAGDRFALHLIPKSLIGAMWFQCARMMTGELNFRQCENDRCKKWFEVAVDGRKDRMRFCTPSCKVAAFRLRNPRQKTTGKKLGVKKK